jgi:hypothetical protein
MSRIQSQGGLKVIKFQAFPGTITRIEDLWINENKGLVGCIKRMSVENEDGTLVNFVVEPTTYFVAHTKVQVGDRVIGFYDANAPAILIYPPQFRAIVMAKDTQSYNVKVDYFDNQLVSEDGKLKLNIGTSTDIVMENGQSFTKKPVDRYLIVVYGASTKSIPAQTTPYKIIVMCISDNR